MPHIGRHHYARCGEYRPLDPKAECPECDPVCPGCGSHYNKPKPVRRCPICAQQAPTNCTDEQFNAHIQRHEGTPDALGKV